MTHAGYKSWWLNGELHRTDGPALEHADGAKEWCVGGIRHRTDGPAFIARNGRKDWHFDGKLHNINGPTIVYKTGKPRYYLLGKRIAPDNWDAAQQEYMANLKLQPDLCTKAQLG